MQKKNDFSTFNMIKLNLIWKNYYYISTYNEYAIFRLKMTKILKTSKKAINQRCRSLRYRYIKKTMELDRLFSTRNSTQDHPISENNEQSLPKKLDEMLRDWAIKFTIKRNSLTALLNILISFGITSLPGDSRTLMKTERVVTIVDRVGGRYWHNGLVACLERTFDELNSNMNIEINISIDGLPLFRSSSVAFWPILFNIHGMFIEID